MRDAEDLLTARGVVVSYETIRAWVAKLGSEYAKVRAVAYIPEMSHTADIGALRSE